MELNLPKKWFEKAAKADEGDFNINPENKYYSSVQKVLEDIDLTLEEIKEQREKRVICNHLSSMRVASDISMKDFAAKADKMDKLCVWAEQDVEDLEFGWDEDLNLADIALYIRICGNE